MTGKELDIVGLVREIRTVAQGRRASGDVPEDLEQSVEESFRRFAPPEPARESVRIREAVRLAGEELVVDHDVSTASRHSYLVPVKRGVRAAVGWYVGAIVARVQDSIRANLQAVEVAGDVIESIEDRLEELEAQVAKLQRGLEGERTR